MICKTKNEYNCPLTPSRLWRRAGRSASKIILALVVIVFAGPSSAGEKPGITTGPYLGLQGALVSADDFDKGTGGALGFGHRWPRYALELALLQEQYASGPQDDARVSGAAVRLHWFAFDSLSGFFLGVGAGGVEVKDYLPDATFGLFQLEGGAGYLASFGPASYRWSVRLEVLHRYSQRDTRINFRQEDLHIPHDFNDAVLRVGLQLPLSRGQVTPLVRDEGVEVVSPTDDGDGDGVGNASDQCPETVSGQPVNAAGCAVD